MVDENADGGVSSYKIPGLIVERLSNPYVFTYAIAFLLFNWKTLFKLLTDQSSVEAVDFGIWSYASPALITLFYVPAAPYVAYVAEFLQGSSKRLKVNEIYKTIQLRAQKQTDVDLEFRRKSLQLSKEENEVQSALLKSTNELNDSLVAYRNRHNELFNQLLSLRILDQISSRELSEQVKQIEISRGNIRKKIDDNLTMPSLFAIKNQELRMVTFNTLNSAVWLRENENEIYTELSKAIFEEDKERYDQAIQQLREKFPSSREKAREAQESSDD